MDLDVIPAPTTLTRHSAAFVGPPATSVAAPAEAALAAGFLARSLGLDTTMNAPKTDGVISLTLDGPTDLGGEGYRLDVDRSGVRLSALTGEGLFRGVQTLCQIATVTNDSAIRIPGVRIEDKPRYAWRGVMLDVARHFFPVADIKRFIDLVVPYKINVLHLHLTDDPGWRIAIDSWPLLAEYGGGTEVGDGPGGHYSKADLAEIVRYAAERYLTVVPEIDMPGHVHAALASYPELTADGTAVERYTGTDVGFSSFQTGKEITYRFVDDVIGEVAALTPGPYLHIGGDEAHSTEPADYRAFMARAAEIVERHGKTLMAWQEAALSGELRPGSVVQYWRPAVGTEPETKAAREALAQGARLVLSPAPRTYLDMKYDGQTRLGQDWAGTVETRQAYEWDPATLIDGVGEPDILGVEAPLWTETLVSWPDLTYMTLPRLPALAEVGWSAQADRSWPDFVRRLAAHGARWTAAGVEFHRSAEVPWTP